MGPLLYLFTHPSLANGLSPYLAKGRVRFESFSSADKLLSAVKSKPAFLALVDLDLPGAMETVMSLHALQPSLKPWLGLISLGEPEFTQGWSEAFWFQSPAQPQHLGSQIGLLLKLVEANGKAKNLQNRLDQEEESRLASEKQLKAFGNQLEQQVTTRTRQLALELEELKRQNSGSSQTKDLVQERLLEDLLDSLPISIYLKDPQGKVILANREFCQLLGKDKDQIFGRSFSSLLDLEAAGEDLHTDRQALETPKGLRFEETLNLKGKRLELYRGKFPFWIEGLPEAHLLGYVLEITDKKRLETKLSQTQKLEALGTMAGGIAHDFNNLLFAMILNLNLIKKANPDNPKTLAYADRTLEAGLRAKDLTKQILAFSRQQERRMEQVDVSKVLDEAYGLIRTGTEKNILIERHYRCPNPCVMGDPSQIHRVIMNLTGNAAFALKDRGGRIDLILEEWKITAQDTLAHDLKPGDYLRLAVTDNGPGIDPKIMPRIFDPFFSTKSSDEGSGLGLSVVLGILQSHKGHILCQSTLGKGTVFEVYLPLVQNDLANPPLAQVNQGEASALSQGAKILLVDDEVLVLEAMTDLLTSEGFVVSSFCDSIAALKEFLGHAFEYDLVISDQSMPHLSGLELAQALTKARKELPVILYSGFNQQLTEQSALKAGAKALLPKPIEQELLLSTIANLLPNRQQHG